MATLTQNVRTIRTDNSGYYTYKCDVTENSYNVANNTSNVTITFSIKGPWSTAAFYQWNTYYGIIVDGSIKQSDSSQPYVAGSYVSLLTWTGDIAHNSDGTKNINVSVYLYNGSEGYLPLQYNSSAPLSMGSVTLTTIPRASTITSAGNVTLGNACSIKWTPASSNFKYKIKFVIGSWNYTTEFISPGTTSEYTYTGYTISGTTTANSTTIYAQLPSSISGTMTATLTTYNSSGTQIGSTSSKTFTVTVPSSVKPTIGTITLTPQTYNYLIQNKNTVKVSVSGCSAGTGSSIKSYTFSGPGISSGATTNTSVTSSVVSTSGTLDYTVTVTDNRGRTTSKTAPITCYAYSAPSITLDAYRVASSTSTTESDSGTYLRCAYNLTYSSVNNSNKVTVKILYKKSSASSYSTTTVLTDSTSKSGSETLSSIAIDSTYTVYATITDNYGGSSSSTIKTIFGASRILNITSDGTGVAFGKMAESNNLFESKWPAKFDDTCQINGTLTVGASTQSITPTAGIKIHDVRNANVTPDSFGDQNVNFYFDDPSGWKSIMHMKGWAGSYAAWELAGNASTSISYPYSNLYYRQGVGDTWDDWQIVLTHKNCENYAVTKPTTLYSSTGGSVGTIALASSAENFTYLEIFYTDNNSRQPNSVKIYSPNGKYVSLSCIEPSTSGSEPRVYIRTSGWTISGTSMTVGRSDLSGANRGVYGQIYPHANGTNIDVKVTENNYIKIFRILGYK